MKKSKYAIASLIAALTLSSVSTPVQAVPLTGWVDYTVAKTSTGSGVDITITLDTSAYSSDVLVIGAAQPQSGEMLIDPMFALCPSYPPSNFVSECTSYQPSTRTVTTSSPTAMTIVMSFTTAAWNSALSMGQLASKNEQVTQIGMTLPTARLLGGNNTANVRLYSRVSQDSGSGTRSTTPRAAARYEGPEILAVDNIRPIVSGGKLTFTGKNLSAVSSATIGSVAATLSYDVSTGLTIATPPVLAPGKYDLVMQSSYGKLTHINAVTIKAPTPTATIGFRSDAQHLNEKQVLDLVAFNETLNSDYEKVRCIVNASDPKTAKRIADLVCAQVARGEARNVEVIKDLRNTYSGTGFWVRVYAAG